ncbi:MAG: DEAD/DEAH box helicase [Acidobacteria bacterium]|nr:MAG: DEAD/DEAH box helicase [Acidobacteriota bacterium]
MGRPREPAAGAQQDPENGSRRPTHDPRQGLLPGREPRRPRRAGASRARPPERGKVSRSPASPVPKAGFARLGLGPAVLRAVADAGYRAPRPIQERTIPAVLRGRDVLGLARTGTGKTAAFALPILDRLTERRAPGPRALVLAPTRELAAQIAGEFRTLARGTGLRTATVFGGVPERPQIAALRGQPDVVVACPGRLLDLLGRRLVRLERIETLVLDEADHMFDMGFLPDVRRILAALPARRQNLLFSATMPREIRALADRMLRGPLVVDLTRGGRLETIEHAIVPVEERAKRTALDRLLAEPGFASAIVFTRTKHRARRLAHQLSEAGRRAVALQGNMSQSARGRAMRGFRDRTYEILVATDIAARGIDVPGVSHVINFDMPGTPEAYTHRIGRTGRSGCDGKAYTLATRDDSEMVARVERRLGTPIPRLRTEGAGPGRDRSGPALRSRPRGSRSRGAGKARRSRW